MYRSLGILFLSVFALVSFSQSGIDHDFGKNRIQHHDDFDDWYMYETQNFVTYWYGKARNVGQVSLSLAELDFNGIESILEHKLNDKIEIICYTDVSDLKQSNIGIDEVFISRNDRTTVSGNRIFVYYDGDHNHLRKQIREGIGEVYLNAMLYGSGLSGLVQKSIQLKIPDWFKEGLIAYLGDEWNVKTDNELRDFLSIYPNKKFEALAKDKPRLMGHAFWNYITREYGKSNVSNILYLARINRNIKSSFLYILGIPFEQIAISCVDLFRKTYQEDRKVLRSFNDNQSLAIKNKKRLPIYQVKVSPNGKEVAYAVNNRGRYKLYVQNLQHGDKPRKIFAAGIKNNVQETDYTVPTFAWHPDGKSIALITERHDVWWLYLLDKESGIISADKLSPEYQRVYALDWINDSKLLLDASTDALSDLYVYRPITRESVRINQDFYDDLDASYGTLMGKKGILFKSNRPLDTLFTMPLDSLLPVQPFNLYFLPFDTSLTTHKLIRLTSNLYYEIDRPNISGPNQISYLQDENGVKQRKTMTIDDQGKIITISSSKGDRDLLAFHAAEGTGVGGIKKGSRFMLFKENLLRTDTTLHGLTGYRITQLKNHSIEAGPNSEISVQATESKPGVNTTAVSKEYSLFQSPFPDPVEIKLENKQKNDSFVSPSAIDSALQPKKNATMDTNHHSPVVSFNPLRTQVPEKFSFIRMVASRLKFKVDRVTTNMDNGLLFGGLNSYAGTKRGFEYPPPGFLIKGQIKDIFEDYSFEGGVRIPTDFNGTEYFLTFEDNKKRIDKKFGIYRQTRYVTEPLTNILANRRRNRTMIGVAQFKYPFDTYQSVRLTGTIRFDRSVLLATDPQNINVSPETTQRAGLKAEYIYDNTTPIDVTRFTGSRAKLFIEAVKKMQIQVFDNWKLDLAKGFMTVMGFDARQYFGLDRRTILALRAAGATSFGSEKILFFLGGVDGWLIPQYEEDTPTPSGTGYAYYGLGANLRGFKQNVRNGTSYALVNAELRVPIFQYLSSKEIRSSFFRNFQVVGFGDVGTAWFGRSPFDQNSPLNTTSVTNTKVKIDLIYARDPVVAGYGAGLRMTILGYQIRADYAWGIETREVQKPKLYLALGADF